MIPSAEGRIPMSDGAGVVEAVGEGVTGFKPGDLAVSLFFPDWSDGTPPASAFTRVPGDGIDGYAREAVVVPEHWFTRVPSGYSAAEAATLTCAGLTAWRALFVDNAIRPGQTVLVQGTGGVSVFALQFAKAAGARVIATSSSDAKLERMKALGADELINYKETPAWGMKALELTGGAGVDCVVEIGGAGTLDQSMMATRVGGHVALIGVLAGFAGPVPDRAADGEEPASSGPDRGQPRPAARHDRRDRGERDQAGDFRPLPVGPPPRCLPPPGGERPFRQDRGGYLSRSSP